MENPETTKTDTADKESPNISYARYQELGGVINEADYNSAMKQAGKREEQDERMKVQVEYMADTALGDIGKRHTKKIIDLYSALRLDMKPDENYYHGQMSDQRLLAEALRMLDYPDLLEKVIKTYPKIDFTG